MLPRCPLIRQVLHAAPHHDTTTPQPSLAGTPQLDMVSNLLFDALDFDKEDFIPAMRLSGKFARGSSLWPAFGTGNYEANIVISL